MPGSNCNEPLGGEAIDFRGNGKVTNCPVKLFHSRPFSIGLRRRRGLHPVVKPDHTAFQGFRVEKPERLAGRRSFIGLACILEDARHPGQSIDARVHQDADLVDQPCFQECTVDGAAALEQESPDPEVWKGCLWQKGCSEGATSLSITAGIARRRRAPS